PPEPPVPPLPPAPPEPAPPPVPPVERSWNPLQPADTPMAMATTSTRRIRFPSARRCTEQPLLAAHAKLSLGSQCYVCAIATCALACAASRALSARCR